MASHGYIQIQLKPQLTLSVHLKAEIDLAEQNRMESEACPLSSSPTFFSVSVCSVHVSAHMQTCVWRTEVDGSHFSWPIYLLRDGFLLNLQLTSCSGSLAVPKDTISAFRVLELQESAGFGMITRRQLCSLGLYWELGNSSPHTWEDALYPEPSCQPLIYFKFCLTKDSVTLTNNLFCTHVDTPKFTLRRTRIDYQTALLGRIRWKDCNYNGYLPKHASHRGALAERF